MPSELPRPENKLFYPALDGLRALAVLMVFYQHYLLYLSPVLNWGWAGVDIFFVLSGFLITGILYDTRNTAHRFRNFYARRTLRIFPLYYAVLLSALLLTPIFHWLWTPSWFLWFSYLGNYARFVYLSNHTIPPASIENFLAQPPYHLLPSLNLTHFWSLCVEEQFYLVWPVIVFGIRDRVRLRNACLIGICGALIARIVCSVVVPQQYLAAGLLTSVTPLRADALLMGGLLALCLRGPEAERLGSLARGALIIFVSGFVLGQGLYLVGTHHLYPVIFGPMMGTIGYTLIDLFSAVLILSLLNPGGILFRVFTFKWARELGKISYGFYIFHELLHDFWLAIVTHLLPKSHHKGGVTAAVALFGTIVISYLSFRFFEQPFLRLKSGFSVEANPRAVSFRLSELFVRRGSNHPVNDVPFTAKDLAAMPAATAAEAPQSATGCQP